MKLEYRISHLAIASLVFGMLFYIPLISGILATIFGIKAYFSIKKSDGNILGKNIAISGIVLGGLQLFIWCLILFSGIFYIVEQNQQAVVTYSGKFIRESYPGFHVKIPFIEKVYFYPAKHNHFTFETEPTKIFIKTKEAVMVSVGVKWAVCDVKTVFNTLNGFSNPSSVQTIISSVLFDNIRLEAFKYDSVSEFRNPSDQYEKLLNESNSVLYKKYGICLIRYDAKSDWLKLSISGDS